MLTNRTLKELNDEETFLYIWPIVFVCIVMIIGILGNGTVLLVYKLKIKNTSNYRLFVLTLAFLDVTASFAGMPGLIVDMLLPFQFYSSAACKLLRYGFHVISCASSMTHLLIGIERHRKICGLLQTQMSLKAATIALAFIFLLALTLSVPALIIYGTYTFVIEGTNVTAVQCHIENKYISTSYPLGYDITLLLLVIFTVVSLTMLYIQIGRQLLKSSLLVFPKDKTKAESNSATINKTKISRTKHVENIPNDEQTFDDVGENVNVNKKLSGKQDIEREQQMISGFSVSENHGTNNNQRESRNKRMQREGLKNQKLWKAITVRQLSQETRSKKVTAITFVITVIFTVSFLPYLASVIADSVNHNIRASMTTTQNAWYQVAKMSYIMNNAANPFVYYMMDTEFRMHSQKILCSTCFS